MLVLQFDYSSYFSNICCLTYAFVYELFCMRLYESCQRYVVVLTCHFGLWTIPLPACDFIQLVCSFHVAYYYKLLRDIFHFPLYVLEPPCISFDSLQGHTLSSDKHITLTFVHYHSQGITILPTVGTPTPNSLRSSWDFLPRRSTDMLVGPTPSIGLQGTIVSFLIPSFLKKYMNSFEVYYLPFSDFQILIFFLI